MKRKILLVASKVGYQTRSFDEAAAKLGLDLRLATDRCHVLDDPWGDRAIPIQFDRPDTAADDISASSDGILAVGDRPALVASYIAERHQIPFHPVAAVIAARNKFLTRQCLKAAGLPVPEHFTMPCEFISPDLHETLSFPVVLKPLGLSGSRGVIRANNQREFTEAFARIRSLLNDPEIRRLHDPQDRLIQVEQFIPGREFALEGLMTNGRLHTLAIFDKPDPLDGPFFEETIYVTPSRQLPPVQQAIVGAARLAVDALGLLHGPIHAEMRVNDDGVWMLEVAARPIGGLCANALRFGPPASEQISLEELLLLHAAGEDVTAIERESPASGVMMIPIPKAGVYTGTVGVDQAFAYPGITEVVLTAKEGQLLLPLPEGASYLGFLFARCPKPEDVEEALRKAHACLNFSISPALPVTR